MPDEAKQPGAASYYPLAVGNSWTYVTKDGKTFTNTITEEEDGVFSTQNSMMPRIQHVRRDGDDLLSDNFEPGNYQVFLNEELKKDDSWEVQYKAGRIENVLIMKVVDTGLTKDVEGKTYEDVAELEGDLRMKMEDNLVVTNFVVTYYYARGVGLLLTKTSYGDSMALVSYGLK